MSADARDQPAESEAVVLGYCVHCRTRRPMHSAIQVCNKRGRHDIKGHCAVCGKSMYRLGGWDSVASPGPDVRDGMAAQHSTDQADGGNHR